MTSNEAPVRFGINFLPDAVDETLDWAVTAEETGFDIVGIADSQSLYRDVYMCAAVCARHTERIRIGPRVINPLTRHPGVAASAAATLEELAPGRSMLGVGSGDSAVLNLGVRPASLDRMREYLAAVRELLTTGRTVYRGGECRLTWGQAPVPLYLAASGPRTLQLAGEIADGVIINTGLLPEIVRDSVSQVRAGCERAGRDLAEVDMWWLPLTNVAASREAAVEEIAMSLASAGSHLSRFTTEGKHIPADRLDAVVALGDRYRADEHDQPASSNRELIKDLGLLDYLADRFAVAGTPADCIGKLEGAVAAGARQFWMSVHFDDKSRFMRDWAAEVMPAFGR